jgi:hypothetical protein
VNSITLNNKGKTIASSSQGSSRRVRFLSSLSCRFSSLIDRFFFL